MPDRMRFTALLATLVCAFAVAEEAKPVAAPDFSATDLSGRAFKLSDYKGKVVVLNFWATWCQTCLAEVPTLVDLYHTYQKDGLAVIGVAFERAKDAEPLKKWLADNKVDYPVVFDPPMKIGDPYVDVPGTGGMDSIPTTLLIDREGKVSDVVMGGQSKEVLEAKIKALLGAEKPKAIPAPDFKATDMSGKSFKLSDYKGKVVVLDFWATWCPPCREEIPGFVDLYHAYRKDGLAVIGIALERSADPKTLHKWLADNKVDYTVALDPKHEVTGLYKDVPGTEGLKAVPTTVLIGRDGTVRKVLVGGEKKEAFEAALKPLLEEKAGK